MHSLLLKLKFSRGGIKDFETIRRARLTTKFWALYVFEGVWRLVWREMFTDAWGKITASFADIASIVMILTSNWLVFTKFKLRNRFSVKDSVPRELLSRVIYKFTCACCKEVMHINWAEPSLNQQPDTYALGFIFFQTLCNSLIYAINFCHLS